jgi:hypothetical protein
MTEGQLFEQVFQHRDLLSHPPVLIDIGASGSIHKQWQQIAKYAVCIAFDADDRDMDYINDKAKNFRQLHIINKIVTDNNEPEADFYLTSSPYCSSLLKPDSKGLAQWRFAPLFSIDKIVKLPAISLKKTLADLNIEYVDWFKSDSQGLDTRLFKNIEQMQSAALIADFEPGFIDAYTGEDKIKDLLGYMETMPFWLSRFVTGQNQRCSAQSLTSDFNFVEIEQLLNRTQSSPIWAEITYINNFKDPQLNTERYYLLGCVFAIILKQYSFAAELAIKGRSLKNNNLFNMIISYLKETTAKPTIKQLLTKPILAKQKIIGLIISQLSKLL